MKILVAGGTGVLGRRAVPLLVQAGHDVSVLSRSAAKAEAIRSQGGAPVEASLFDPDAIRAAAAGHDAVVNLATHIPPVSKSSRAAAWQENDRIRTEGSRNLVDAAIAAGATRYVQESIAFLYPDRGDRWIDESVPLVDSPFTTAVASAEDAAARFTASGGVGVVLRFGQFYAPEATHTQSMVKGATRGWLLLPGKPTAYAVEICADDAAAAVVAALDAPAGVYNVVDDEPMTRAELNEVLAAQVGRAKLRPLPALMQRMVAKKAPNMVGSFRVSNAAFKAATGWVPAYPSFREGAATLFERPAGPAGPAGASTASRPQVTP